MDTPLAFTTTQQPAQLSQEAFVTLLLAIILGWILVAVWTRVVENLAYGTLRLNEDSSWHAFVVALAMTAIFLVFVYLINTYNIVPGQNFGEVFLQADNFPPGVNEI